jgi:hypothetical protein
MVASAAGSMLATARPSDTPEVESDDVRIANAVEIDLGRRDRAGARRV